MNILYLTHLSGAKYAGPTYSVPSQIEAQSKIDDVFWYNLSKIKIEKYAEYPYYHDLNDYPANSIRYLPKPFDKPDLIIVERFYNMALSKLQFELLNLKIPYVIVPRGELTYQAQKRKSIKKKISNILIFNLFAKHASAIHYLTKQEYIDSSDRWNKNHFVIPNGINLPVNKIKKDAKKEIKFLFIGRLEPYQKGLDILLDACCTIKDIMISKHANVSIYGPDTDNKKKGLISIIKRKQLTSIVKIYDAVYGNEKEQVLKTSELFVMPSRFEGHPMALIEALSYGLPAIVSKGSNMKSEIDEYNAGWSFDEKAIELANIFKTVLDKPAATKEKSDSALRLAAEYSWEKIAQRSHIEYKKLIQEIR